MSNLSQIRRAEMLEYLNHLKEIHTDDESRIALGKIETALTEKKYGLVWEEHEEEVVEYEKKAYKEYNTSMTTSGFRSTSEQLIENYLESRDDVDWYYKNRDTGQQYLSIIYGNNLSKVYLFYPDYIIKKKNGEVWIIEIKGGERKGVS